MQDLRQKVLENLKTKGYHEYQLKELTPIIQATIEATKQSLSIASVSHRRELLLAAICEYNKYNTQRDIKAVDDWLKDWDSK